MQTTYKIKWNPDGRWLSRHWTVVRHAMGCTSSMDYNFLSEALRHPLEIWEQYPENTKIFLPPVSDVERARKYYGRVLETIINENEGKYIGC